MSIQPVEDDISMEKTDVPAPTSHFGVPLWTAIGVFLGLFGQVVFFAGLYYIEDGQRYSIDHVISPYLRVLLLAVPILVVLFSDNEFGRQFPPWLSRFLRRLGRSWYLMICFLAIMAGNAGWHPQGWPVYAVFMALGVIACWRVG